MNTIEDKTNRWHRIWHRIPSLKGSWFARHWRITILPALLIVLVLVVVNWRLRSGLGPEEPFSDFTFPYEQTFDDVQINRWFTTGGKWTVQAGTLIQADQSAEPAKIFVPKWLPEGKPYHLTVEITMGEETQSAGINFNAQYPEIYRDHQRISVARNGDQLELLTGTVNEVDGFQAESSVLLPTPADTLKLDLLVDNEAYDLLINGQMFVQQQPLAYTDGLVGLFAISGPARFDNLTLDTLDESFIGDGSGVGSGPAPEAIVTADAPAPAAQSLAYLSNFSGGEADGWVPISGDWRVENGRLTQFKETGYDYATGYRDITFQSYTLVATLTHLNGTGGGLLFNMAAPDQIKDTHIVRYSDRSDAIVYGYFDASGVFNSQGFSNVAAPGSDEHTIKVVSSESTYDLYLDDQIIASEIPLNRSGGFIGLVTAQSSVAYGQIDVSAAPGDTAVAAKPDPEQPDPAVVDENTNVSTSAVVATQAAPTVETVAASADSNPGSLTTTLDGWTTISGQWKAEGGKLAQADKDGFDLAVGYAGSAYSSVDLEATVMHIDGIGAGVLFNMPAANSLKGAHMVRFADWADALVWGYFDETGQFKGQGYAKIEAPGTSAHTIRVSSGSGSYTVYLDGQQLASNLPLLSDGGHIGLITSKTQAAFGPIQVGSDGQAVTGAAVSQQPSVTPEKPGDIFGDIETISGEWVREGTKLSQLNPATYDFSISTGVYAGVYTLETAIALPEDPEMEDAGGGILFHMPERDSRTGSHMVRFAGRGELIWGYYDQNGAFVGQGREQVGAADQTTHKLKIVVEKDVYQIIVDGKDIVQDVPLKQQEGWIGLVSYRGPVVFEGISVTFGTAE